MNILIVTKNWLGDILFEFPAIEAIRNRYPDAHLCAMGPSRCREILASHPAINQVLVFDERNEHRSLASRLRFIRRLRRENWDRAYLFHPSRTRAFLLLLAGVRERIGYGAGRKLFLTHPVAEPEEPMHQVDYFLYLLEQTGLCVPENAAYRFYLSRRDQEAAKAMLGDHSLRSGAFACFHLGANWEPKRWPVAHFAKLADLIFAESRLPILLTGGAQDSGLIAGMKQQVKKARLISLAGKTGLGELAAIYRHATFVVSGDSGPMHIASAVGTNLVALFGPTNPKLTGPRGTGDKVLLSYVPPGYGAPWFGKNIPEDWLSHIQPEEVLQALEEKKWLGFSAEMVSAEKAPAGASGKKFFGGPKFSGSNPKRILLIAPTNIGDVVLVTPVLMALVSEFPNAKITAVTGPRSAELLEGSRFLEEVAVYDKKASLRKKLAFLKKIRRQTYDIVVDLRNSAIPFLVKSRQRSPLFRRSSALSTRQRHLEVLPRMGLAAEARIPFDFFSPEEESEALEKLKSRGIMSQRDWVLIAPIAASLVKTWRLDGFRDVIEYLLSEQSEPILLLGDLNQRQAIAPLAEIAPLRVHNLAGQTTIREAAALIGHGSLLVANDSSLIHLGYEMNRPVVAIFGPTHHEKYGRQGPQFRIVREGVFCSPCEASRCRFERRACLEDLKSEKVIQACEELLHVSSV